MADSQLGTTELQELLERSRAGDSTARERLAQSVMHRLEQLARQMLRGFPVVRRAEDTNDVMNDALMRFLDSMSAGWNISLFHYRNHGADYGRVLVGMQVPSGDKAEFRRFLDRLGYDYIEETANPAYQMFLGR